MNSSINSACYFLTSMLFHAACFSSEQVFSCYLLSVKTFANYLLLDYAQIILALFNTMCFLSCNIFFFNFAKKSSCCILRPIRISKNMQHEKGSYKLSDAFHCLKSCLTSPTFACLSSNMQTHQKQVWFSCIVACKCMCKIPNLT